MRGVATVELLLVVLVVVLAEGKRATGTLEDIEHIVIFMQENRAFDHYYGKLRGVRGFNDRAAPPLPSGKEVWYQPVKKEEPVVPLCGCGGCDIKWTSKGSEIKETLMTMKCGDLVEALKGANPPVAVEEGEACSKLLGDLMKSSLDHFKFSDFVESDSSCRADLKVTGLGVGDDEPYMLPFPLYFNKTSATCMPAPEMDYHTDVHMWNAGRMDSWNTARTPGFGMSYFDRTDLPYYYALADAFTVGDQYFQSTFTQTNPNRLHLFTGSNGLSVNGSGFCILDDQEPSGVRWETMAETLMKANVSWKVYQEHDNFDDNAFAWFDQFREAKPGNPLYDLGMKRSEDVVKEFAADVANDALPSVSWIVGPTHLSEHAENHPADGEDLSARLLKVLADPANRAVYAKTAFILNYDEGGQFFDHHWTPTPPTSASDGKSTVSVEGELTTKVVEGIPAGTPIGLGFRVPLFVVSPWTRGGNVYSEVSDHTSVVKLIERRFGVRCPNISPWRRAVTGDLVGAFDFGSADLSWPTLPDTSGNVNASKHQCDDLPAPTVPTEQRMPRQEVGTRPSRALPYEFQVRDATAGGKVNVTVANTGAAGAVFQVHDLQDGAGRPRKYTVEAGKAVWDEWEFSGEYRLSLHGPNGFVREFGGDKGGVRWGLTTWVEYIPGEDQVVVRTGPGSCDFRVVDNAYDHGGPWRLIPNAALTVTTRSSGNWYDLTVMSRCVDFSRRFMGRMETGRGSITDPAMGGFVPAPLSSPGGLGAPGLWVLLLACTLCLL